MRSYKHVLFILISALYVSMLSCTSDEAGSNLPYITDSGVHNNGGTCYGIDSVFMEFHLQNEQGDTTNIFSVGDDIIFDLIVYNGKTTPLAYGLPELFGINTFRVYTSNMADCGIPWVYERDWDDKLRRLKPGGKLHFQCSWYGCSNSPFTFPAPKNNNTLQLNPGVYHTSAYIQFEKSSELCVTLNFVINENK